MNAETVLTFLHLLAAFWYVMGLSAAQVAMVRGWRAPDLPLQAAALEEASRYQGVLLVPGAIALGVSGLFLWAEMGYNLVTTGWLLALEGLYLLTLLVCLPVVGLGLRRARLASLQAQKAGRAGPELEEALSDTAPLAFSGIASVLVPAMTYLSVFKPF